MSKCTLRNILTVLIYAGVAAFLYPYLTGRLSGGILFLVGGISLAVVCGILRAACMEGDCAEREYLESVHREPNQVNTTTHSDVPSHT